MKTRIFTAILLVLATAFSVDAQTRRSTAKTQSTSQSQSTQADVKQLTPVDQLVNKFNEINSKLQGVSSQQRMGQIIESCVADLDISYDEAQNTVLTESDKARLSKSLIDIFSTMAINVGGPQAQSQLSALASMINTQVGRSSTLLDLSKNLNMGLFKQTTGRSSF